MRIASQGTDSNRQIIGITNNACYAKTDSATENGLEVSDEIAAI